MKTFAKIFFASIITICFVSIAIVRPARAATIDVPCGDEPGLIAAINTANSTPETDTIRLGQACDYELTMADNTSAEFGPNGLPVITTKIIIQGGAIRRRQNSTFRFFLVAPTGNLVLKNMKLTNGRTGMTDSPGVAYSGGAIYNNAGALKVKGSQFFANYVNPSGTGYGGAIYNDNGNVVWINSEATGNGGNVGGGVIYNDGTLNVKSGSFFTNGGGAGGAIVNLQQARLFNALFENNSADTDTAGVPEEGGAITNYGTMRINRVTFDHNHSKGAGGAIANFGPLTAIGSAFWRNEAPDGGAILNQSLDESMILANSTLHLNNASQTGGALLNQGAMQILGVTLAENIAGEGGNLVSSPNATTIVANTIITMGAPQNCVGVLDVQKGNLRFPETDPSCEGEYGDPMLDTFQSYGGPTSSMALKPGSRAINKGVRDNCLREAVDNKDQRGVARILGDEPRCDSGAYEVE